MESNLFRCELQLLGEEAHDDQNDFSFMENDGSVDLLHHLIADVWKSSPDKESNENFENYLIHIVCNYLKSSGDDETNLRQISVLCQGVELLHRFVQINWTGPPRPEDDQLLQLLLKEPISNFFGNNSNFEANLSGLVTNGLSEECFLLKVKHPEYLWLAKILLCSCNHLLDKCFSAAWWALRCVFLNQQILNEKSCVLSDQANGFIEKGIGVESFVANDKYKLLQIHFYLEASRVFLHYYNISKSKENFNSAQKIAGISSFVTGALGKRTYHQQEDKSQLVLKIDFLDERLKKDQTNQDVHDILPKDIKLDDSVRLNAIIFKDESVLTLPDMLPEEQAIILNLFYQIQKSNAVDDLINEELYPYLTALLSQPKNWAIQTSALFCRSMLEINHSRTIERAMRQLEVLNEHYNNATPTAVKRRSLFHCVAFPPIWQIELNLAKILRKLGAVNSALDIYLKLENWEDIIQCYIILQRKGKAEEIIRQQLSVKETPALWCYLAEVTSEPEHYIKAWELSGHRSFQAQKGLGVLLYSQKQYAECIPHFQKSLEINKLQLGVWSALAYAAMQIENWELTASSYRHCLNLEPDNFQAWNNLSNAYIRLNQKSRAWKTLQEALKCNYDDWRIWENYLLVSTDCGAFEEVLTSYHRILDLKEKHLDLEVLSIIVHAISHKMHDNNGVNAERLLPKALELFGRLTAQIPNNSKLWALYADLMIQKTEENAVKNDKVSQFLQRAHRYSVAKQNWEKDMESCKEVVNLSLRLADDYICNSNELEGNNRLQLLNVAKLMLKGVITKLKIYQDSLIEDNVELQALQTTLDEKLKTIENT